MGGKSQRPEKPGRPLTIRAIVSGGVLVCLVGVIAVVALLYFYGGGTDRERAGLEVVRTAGTLVIGTGGAIALLLTARRQRSTELTLEHQRKVAAATERDAAEQRITELYTRAVDQLGNEKAPVRLGGLHALERLAQNNPGQRQTIIDVICAYLRMPYTPPEDEPPPEDIPAETRTRYELRREELQVRLTAQRILAAHVKPDRADVFWGTGIDLDLNDAYLHRLDLSGCRLGRVEFAGARFEGGARFVGAEFTGNASFVGAKFAGSARFGRADFARDAWFDGAEFAGEMWFGAAQFHQRREFAGARVRQAPGIRHGPWPPGWATTDARAASEKEEEGWLVLVPVKDSTG
jgi:hypothetical protein